MEILLWFLSQVENKAQCVAEQSENNYNQHIHGLHVLQKQIHLGEWSWTEVEIHHFCK